MSDDKIIVRRAVYDAACKLEEQNKKENRYPNADFMMAEEQQDACLAEGNQEEADFWKEVYQYLMTLECVAAGTPVEIID